MRAVLWPPASFCCAVLHPAAPCCAQVEVDGDMGLTAVVLDSYVEFVYTEVLKNSMQVGQWEGGRLMLSLP